MYVRHIYKRFCMSTPISILNWIKINTDVSNSNPLLHGFFLSVFPLLIYNFPLNNEKSGSHCMPFINLVFKSQYIVDPPSRPNSKYSSHKNIWQEYSRKLQNNKTWNCHVPATIYIAFTFVFYTIYWVMKKSVRTEFLARFSTLSYIVLDFASNLEVI